MKIKKNKITLGKLFYNDKFVMCFSVLVAFFLWLAVSGTTQENAIFTVTEIPINLPALSNDLRFFTSTSDITAEVKISGNTLIVANVTNSDIYITASDISNVTEPGNYKLNLVPKKTGIKTDYTFESTVAPSSIEVYVDRYAEKEIPITDRIDVSSIDTESYAATTTLSQQYIKVSGAESVVNSIAEAAAEYTFTGTLSETTTVDANIVCYDMLGHRIDTTYITLETNYVSATVPILKIKELEIIPAFVNAPDTFVQDKSCITVSPATVQIAVPADSEIESISTDPIDLSKVTTTANSYTVNLIIPSGCKNLNQISKANVLFERNMISTKKVTLSKFTVINASTEKNTAVSTKSIEITLVGEKQQINMINNSNLTAVVDMSQKASFTGFAEMPVTISINSKFPFVWVTGSYEVDVNVTDITIPSSGQSSES